MKVKTTYKKGILFLYLTGELDMYNAADFRNQIDGLINRIKPRGILFNLTELIYIDSSGIGLMLSLIKKTSQANCLTCFCHIQNQVLDVIKLTRILSFFTIRDSEKDGFNYLIDIIGGPELEGHGPIFINEESPLMDKKGMRFKRINLDFKRIRYMSHLITKDAPKEIKEYNLLEQQVSEIIKNGVRHGNKNDIGKALNIWWSFTSSQARLIVEDEGEGFQNLEDWLDFFWKRMKCFEQSDFDNMTDYLSYRTRDSTEDDGGNAMFAAVEYWNRGVVMNKRKNCIAVARNFEVR